jgi:AAA family ATP:ADP antiporter
MMIVAQFWSLANDLYTRDEGERLFPIVGFGASLGAVLGASVAGGFITRLGVFEPMLLGAALLVIEVMLTNYIDWRQRARARRPMSVHSATSDGTNSGAFGLVVRTRYLLVIALMLMLHNSVKTTGEFLLGRTVRESAVRLVGANDPEGVKRTIGGFYSNFYASVNIAGLLLQLFVVSRVVKKFGVPSAVLVLPMVSAVTYGVIALVPFLAAVFGAKVAENATDYSLNNTVRNMLFLPCTTEQKYSAKQAIDTFFVRLGDMGAAAIVFIGTTWLTLSVTSFAIINASLVLVWFALAWRAGQQYRELTESGRHPETSGAWFFTAAKPVGDMPVAN